MPGHRQSIFPCYNGLPDMKLSDAEIDKLLTDLSSDNAETRDKAERFYNENKATILPQLTSVFDNTIVAQGMLHQFLHIVYVSFFAGGLIALLSLYIKNHRVLPLIMWFFVAAFPLIALFPLKKRILHQKPTARKLTIVRLMSELNEPCYIPFYIDLLETNPSDMKQIAEPILYRQLSLIEDQSHIGVLRKSHLRYLYERLLTFGGKREDRFDKPKALAIVNALGHIGDLYALKPLAIVVRDSLSVEVKETAANSMQKISKRISEEEPRKILLRASEDSGGQDELLRAANAQSDTQPETLLRVPKQEP